MRREEAFDPARGAARLTKRVADKEVRGSKVCVAHWHGIGSNLFERRGETGRIPSQESAGGVGKVLPATTNGKLDELRGKRCKYDGNDGKDHEDSAALIVIISSAATHKRGVQKDVCHKR